MLPSARRRHSSTPLVALIALVSACGEREREPAGSSPSGAAPAATADPTTRATGDAPAGPTTSASGDAPPADSGAASGGSIQITFSEDRPGQALARRCVLDGDPAAADCSGGGEGLALDGAGLLYLVVGKEVRRYRRAEGPDCRFEPAGDPIALPSDNPRPQSIDGPMYMRSGGAAWHVVAAGGAIYAHDYLGGLYRIDSGKAVPACVDVFGFGSVTALRGKLLIGRNGIEQLAPGKRCKARSARIDDKIRGHVHAIGEKLYVAHVGELTRFDGKTAVKLGEGTRMCAITGLAACGDGICAMDHNCMQVIQLAADGAAVRTLESRQLFGSRPWAIGDAVTRASGDVLLYARHRDRTAGKELCEAAVYELPAALFAR